MQANREDRRRKDILARAKKFTQRRMTKRQRRRWQEYILQLSLNHWRTPRSFVLRTKHTYVYHMLVWHWCVWPKFATRKRVRHMGITLPKNIVKHIFAFAQGVTFTVST